MKPLVTLPPTVVLLNGRVVLLADLPAREQVVQDLLVTRSAMPCSGRLLALV